MDTCKLTIVDDPTIEADELYTWVIVCFDTPSTWRGKISALLQGHNYIHCRLYIPLRNSHVCVVEYTQLGFSFGVIHNDDHPNLCGSYNVEGVMLKIPYDVSMLARRMYFFDVLKRKLDYLEAFYQHYVLRTVPFTCSSVINYIIYGVIKNPQPVQLLKQIGGKKHA